MELNIGVIIGRICPNSLEYLLNEKGKFVHFYSIEEAMKYLADNGKSDEEINTYYQFQYHTFCLECGHEYFLSPSDTFVDELGRGYYCKLCDSSFNVI